jgi:hypothetical protein
MKVLCQFDDFWPWLLTIVDHDFWWFPTMVLMTFEHGFWWFPTMVFDDFRRWFLWFILTMFSCIFWQCFYIHFLYNTWISTMFFLIKTKFNLWPWVALHCITPPYQRGGTLMDFPLHPQGSCNLTVAHHVFVYGLHTVFATWWSTTVCICISQTSFSFSGSGGVDRVRCRRWDPPRNRLVLRGVHGAHFHHRCVPLPHRIATLHPWRCGTMCAVFVFIHVRRSRTELVLWIHDGVERCAWCSFSS